VHPLIRLGMELPPLGRGAVGTGAGEGSISLADVARRAEDAALGTLWLCEGPAPGLDPMPLAGSVARVTSTLGIGVAVRPSLGRHPSVVARDITTIDLLSDGRAAVAVIEDGDDPLDVARLGEAASLLRRLLADEEVTVTGRFYEVAELTTRPRPVRPEGPPVVVGIVGRSDTSGLLAVAASVEASVDAWVTGGNPADVAACRSSLDAVTPVGANPMLLWRGVLGGVPEGAREWAASILEAGADGLIAVLDASREAGGAFELAAVVRLLEVLGPISDRLGS
jgi:alkanesulfonate monooxygenase SsuD/methylene tetrahydromethanopterin reductase-like flavin-dependent oxidoreductase (luciferase family)